MFEGGILKAGVPEELVEDEMVRRVYLGQILKKKKLEFKYHPCAYKKTGGTRCKKTYQEQNSREGSRHSHSFQSTDTGQWNN
jgi:hypothetical protein